MHSATYCFTYVVFVLITRLKKDNMLVRQRVLRVHPLPALNPRCDPTAYTAQAALQDGLWLRLTSWEASAGDQREVRLFF